MALGDYLASLNLAPGVAEKLQGQFIGPPNLPPEGPGQYVRAPMGPPDEPPPAPPQTADAQYVKPSNPMGMIPMGEAPPAEPAPTTPGQYVKAPPPEAAAPEADDGGGQGGGAPAAMPMRVSPAHWQPGTRAYTKQYGMTPEELEPGQTSRDAGTGQGMLAIDKQRAAEQDMADAEVGYAQAKQRAEEIASAKRARLEQDRQAYVLREQERLEDLAKKASEKVDVDAAHGSLGAQMLGAIAVGLGQFGAAINGGPNMAYQIISDGINRRIKAQSENIANARASLAARQSLYRQNLDEFGDKERAILATKVQYLDQVRAQVDEVFARSKGTLSEANYNAMQKKLLDERANTLDQFALRTHTQLAEQGNEHYVPAQVVGGGGGGGKALDNLVTLSDGTTVKMPNEKQQDAAIGKVQVLDKLQRMNNRALQIRKKLEKVDPIVNATEYNTLYGELEDMQETKAALLSTDAGQGVLKDSEYWRSIEKQGLYTRGVGFFKGNPVAKSVRDAADANLRKQIERADEDQRAYVKAAGGAIVQKGYQRDAAGNLVPAAKYTGQDVKPSPQLAPKDFKPVRPGLEVPRAPAPLGEVTPQAPVFGGVSPPAPPAPRKK